MFIVAFQTKSKKNNKNPMKTSNNSEQIVKKNLETKTLKQRMKALEEAWKNQRVDGLWALPHEKMPCRFSRSASSWQLPLPRLPPRPARQRRRSSGRFWCFWFVFWAVSLLSLRFFLVLFFFVCFFFFFFFFYLLFFSSLGVFYMFLFVLLKVFHFWADVVW